MSQYKQRDTENLGAYYMRHVLAMTAEKLHDKSAIAAELAWRDLQIDMLTQLIELKKVETAITTYAATPTDENLCAVESATKALGLKMDEAPALIPNHGTLSDYRIDLAAAQIAYDANPSSKNASDLHAAKEALERRQS